MPVSVAIVGPPGSGKTTLFHALVGGRGSDGVGMVDVPDERLGRLAAAVRPKRVVPAQVRLADAPPGSRAQRIAAARDSDVVIQVGRGFAPDPAPAAHGEGTDLALGGPGRATVEKRLGAVRREVRAGKKQGATELAVLERAKEHLDEGPALATLELDRESMPLLQPLFPVSAKPSV